MTAPVEPRRDEWEKWIFLSEAPERDSRDPRVRHIAQALHQAAMGRPRLIVALALCLVREGIKYQLDTARVGREDVAGYLGADRSVFDALERGVDDCDAKGRLFVALVRAAGLGAELVPVWGPDGTLKHVAARARLDGKWEHCEPTLRRGLIGETPREVPTETGGKLAGSWLQ